MAKDKLSVAQYITHQLLLCGRQQKEIADELNYEKPNVITMFKQGTTKVPINKIPAFAKALGVDPVHFLKLALAEYMPETWEVISSVLNTQSMVSEHEMKILDIVRNNSEGYDLAPETDEEVLELMKLVETWRDRRKGLVRAAAKNANPRSKVEL
jgi:hypothetical protein